MQNDSDARLVKVAEAAQFLNCERTEVLRLARKGALRRYRASGPAFFFLPDVRRLAADMDLARQFAAAEGMPASGPCIYFLMRGDRVVYVGQTRNLWYRVGEHTRKGEKDFDGVRFIRAEPEDLLTLEARYIRMLRPPYNGHKKGADRE